MKENLFSIEKVLDKRALYFNVPVEYLIAKRAFDISASFVGIILLLPVFLLTAIAIKLESKGGIFFSQERTGFKGKIFKIYKFRSMVINAEQLLTHIESKNEVSGPMFKIKNDPRITFVGRVIRKTSIDELPQLFNVIKGDMSIVGPRPPLMREVVMYDAWHNLRLSVKPGLTGLWQISGRNNVGFDEMVRLDLKYIRERGFKLDLKIILKTVPILLGDSKAF